MRLGTSHWQVQRVPAFLLGFGLLMLVVGAWDCLDRSGLRAESNRLELGRVLVDTEREFSVRLTNRLDQPIRIVGAFTP